jgi:hypothetical protein
LPEGAPALSGYRKSKTTPTNVEFHGFCGILLVGTSIAINSWYIIDNATDYRQTAKTYSNATSMFRLLRLAWISMVNLFAYWLAVICINVTCNAHMKSERENH